VALVASQRHSAADLDAWRTTERRALVQAELNAFSRHVRSATDALRSFVTLGRCYAGTSWGKDSVALAHLVATQAPHVPLIWIRVTPLENPDCALVRDEFLRRFPGTRYDEIATRGDSTIGTGRLKIGFREASRRHGSRYISGVRGEESGGRARRMRAWGESSPNTCAPLGWWSGWEVFAYLMSNGLPVHPAYACTMDGLLDPTRIRVASLGGSRGEGMGRREWEERYYRDELRTIDLALRK
jgi:phosphoadenosine phosphosulfate reductase